MSAVGPSWRSKAVQALLGPSRSPLVPSQLWLGFLDAGGALVGMSGVSVSHDVWSPSGDGVTNNALLDAGVAGAGWTFAKVGLFDATAGELVLSADLPAPVSPSTGEPLSFPLGSLTFTVA